MTLFRVDWSKDLFFSFFWTNGPVLFLFRVVFDLLRSGSTEWVLVLCACSIVLRCYRASTWRAISTVRKVSCGTKITCIYYYGVSCNVTVCDHKYYPVLIHHASVVQRIISDSTPRGTVQFFIRWEYLVSEFWTSVRKPFTLLCVHDRFFDCWSLGGPTPRHCFLLPLRRSSGGVWAI